MMSMVHPVNFLLYGDNDAMMIFCRATVVEHPDIWFRDDGGLTKMFCEKPSKILHYRVTLKYSAGKLKHPKS